MVNHGQKTNLTTQLGLTSCLQDRDGSLLSNHEVPGRLTGLVPNLAGDPTQNANVPGSFRLLVGKISVRANIYGHNANCGWLFELRLVFPTLQQNTSILQVLPTWIETLGRKIDSAESEKARSRSFFAF